MRTLYLILLIVAGVCFALATVMTPAVGNPRRPLNLVAAGLLFWVLVPLIQTADRLGD
jgi:drug/metabolite transporter (DMT)-like permease